MKCTCGDAICDGRRQGEEPEQQPLHKIMGELCNCSMFDVRFLSAGSPAAQLHFPCQLKTANIYYLSVLPPTPVKNTLPSVF